ncbi:NF038104 family lipoprotein [Snodgrassella sp. CFCC 13594]|uniref:NF038104 family lipoprotein n=1 Tax=Snodgrassella sp. CFCC 13594 TaxID=1775559 RepID=UPI000AA250B5|nr:NF038104 family lipoprotein [Snodgrassella sp. CFCC 13594]
MKKLTQFHVIRSTSMNIVILLTLFAGLLSLQGCVTKLVTVPVKVVYGTTKLVAKGTYHAVKAVIPDGQKKNEAEAHKNDSSNATEPTATPISE